MIRARLLLVGLLLSAFGWQSLYEMLGGPSWVAGVLLPAGLLVVGLALPSGRQHRIAGALGAVLAQAAAAPAAMALLARWQELPGVAAAIAGAARLFGAAAASSDDGRVIFRSGGEVVEFLPSLSRLAAFPLLLALAGICGLALLLPLERPGRALGRCFAAFAGYALARLLLLLLLRADLPENGLETSVWFCLATLLPAAVLLPRRLTVVPVAARRSWRRLAVAASAGLAWALALGFSDPGERKTGRVLFDDSHGDWEPTDTPFDTDHYGQRISYAYSSFYRMLAWYYDVSRHDDGPITDTTLANTDVLILKTPTRPFSPEEVDAVERFVRGGGGLFLIGDHTNLFGMTDALNVVAGRFGLAFRDDDTFALANEGLSHWRRPRLLPHPIAARVPEFGFETSCTLAVPLGARAPIIGNGLGAEKAEYSHPGFFGDIHLGMGDDFGFFVQHAVLDHGRGRVAAFSDSTPLSNFSIFFPGRRELVLATVEYLDRRPTAWRHVPLLAMVVLALSLVGLAKFQRRAAAFATVGSALAGAGLGCFIAALSVRGFELPELRTPVHQVHFDRAISRLVLPNSLSDESSQDPMAMDSLVVAAQRMGSMPVVSDTLAAGLQQRDLVVIIAPQSMPESEQLDALRRFIGQGGSLLIVDGLAQGGVATETLLQAFGMGIRIDLAPSSVRKAGATRMSTSTESDHPPLAFSRPVLDLVGGTPVFQDEQGRTIYSESQFGRGKIGVLVDATTVSKSALGARFAGTPTPQQRAHLELIYQILGRLVEGAH
ncbi:DUF4350 domain-containing protein [Polyangium sp. y55x31]|uniref:DUF4350 domain-containing protein n=1 Tax=Polyangium sp. y55x31 TaxID=3042688 RepID=UPI0024825395|nr:DUF4350 domain-containing protein [Polyangium sp. y55x31]MDI1475973.1 hypothetical protein [Polyangium sp. y55x31]